jgi:hypothetical protein
MIGTFAGYETSKKGCVDHHRNGNQGSVEMVIEPAMTAVEPASVQGAVEHQNPASPVRNENGNFVGTNGELWVSKTSTARNVRAVA